MDRLTACAAPIVIVAVWLAIGRLVGRPPTRAAVGLVTSLLLLAYMLATAGLGLFWVARQELPVFDWHYLVGYCTLVLLS
ncbi:MAG: hypothetical protein HY815_06625, partial [Candidatus Riflebacteria bacterium]|nr:hypothetical protein [Candidatus Riflebacteria bacterium]